MEGTFFWESFVWDVFERMFGECLASFAVNVFCHPSSLHPSLHSKCPSDRISILVLSVSLHASVCLTISPIESHVCLFPYIVILGHSPHRTNAFISISYFLYLYHKHIQGESFFHIREIASLWDVGAGNQSVIASGIIFPGRRLGVHWEILRLRFS